MAPKTLHSRRTERWAVSPALRHAGAKTELVDPDRAEVGASRGRRVSRNTIKTQAISVYRKLDVSRRSDAIERAVELGLLDAGSTDIAALG